MNYSIYTASGCARCRITKEYMQKSGIEYEEFDIKSDGKDAFATFYRANRKKIFRDKNGVEFPVFTDGTVIKQGVSVIIGYLLGGDRLEGFIGKSRLHGEWLDGINISGGRPDAAKALYVVLSHLKKYGLNIEIFSDGGNPAVLEYIFENQLADRVDMEIRELNENKAVQSDLARSLACAAKFKAYRFYTPILPRVRTDETIEFIPPEEIGKIAQFIEESTRSKKHPYLLRPWHPSDTSEEFLKGVDPLPDSIMFKYRTTARRYMVMTEIEKRRTDERLN